jgi:hypothetical protein
MKLCEIPFSFCRGDSPPKRKQKEFRQMRHLIAATAAAMIAFGAGAALASVAMGTVEAVDEDRHTVTLVSGHQFLFPVTVDLEPIKPGTDVTISYALTNGRSEATSIMIDYDR